MVDIKKLCEKVSFDEMTVKTVLESFFKDLGTQYRDSSSFDHMLGNSCHYFNYSGNVEKFEKNYYEDKFHPIVKAYIDELVDNLVENAKHCGAMLYKPYWEDSSYFEGCVRTGSRLNGELIEFCNATNASDEVLTGIFNIALEKLTELGVAWGSVDEFPGACSDEPFYIDGSQWVFQSYEAFKKTMARVFYFEGECILGYDEYDKAKKYITENDIEIVKKRNYDYDKVSDGMRSYLQNAVAACDWIGNEKLKAYAVKFELELAGFGNGYEDDYLEQVAADIIYESKQYAGKDFIDTCRLLLHETKVGNDYCYLKYEKKFDDLSESERDTIMKKVINECISQMRHS